MNRRQTAYIVLMILVGIAAALLMASLVSYAPLICVK